MHRKFFSVLLFILGGLNLIPSAYGQQTANSLSRISVTPSQQLDGVVVRFHSTHHIDSVDVSRPHPRRIAVKISDPSLQADSLQLPTSTSFIDTVRFVRNRDAFITYLYLNNSVPLNINAYPDRNSPHHLMALLKSDSVHNQNTATPFKSRKDTAKAPDSLKRTPTASPSLNLNQLEDTLARLNRDVSHTATVHLKNRDLIGPPASVTELTRMFDFRMADTATSPDVKVLEARKKVNKRDVGLSLEGDYRGTSQSGLFDRARIQFGLEWDILNNGYFDSRREIDQLNTEIQLEQKQFQDKQFEQFYGQLFNRFIYHFNQYKKRLADRYLQLLTREEHISRQLFHLDYLTREEVLTVDSKRRQIRNQLNNFARYEQQFDTYVTDSIDVSKLPVADLQFEKLISAARTEHKQDNPFADIDISSYEAHDPLSDISLSLFMDYNLNSNVAINFSSGQNGFSSNLIGDENFVSYGMRLSVPFPMGNQAREELARARQEKLKADRSEEQPTIAKELSNHYYEYKYRLEDYIEFHRKYLQLNAQIQRELNRKTLEDPEYRPRKVLSLLDTRYDVALETIDIKQQLYLKLLRIYRYVHPRPITEFIEHRSLTVDHRTDNHLNGLYIWSASFKSKSNSFLLGYLNKHGIRTVYLSPGPDDQLHEKARGFIESAKRAGIRVALMIGSNKLIYPDQRDDLTETVKQAASMGAGEVHLDVEPHTFDDWEARQQMYKDYYLGMLKEAAKLTEKHDLRLSVSIPTYYDDIFKEITEWVNKINIMAYGTSKPDVLNERIRSEWESAAHKINVALNMSEFASIQDLESFIDSLQQYRDYQGFTAHDLKSLMRLDNLYLNSND